MRRDVALLLIAGTFHTAVSAAADSATPDACETAIGVERADCLFSPLRPLTISTTEGTWIAIDVSPDGESIAFDLLGKIFTMPIAGGHATQLTTGPAFDERPRFSSDGRYVLFSSDRGNEIDVWRVPQEGGAPEPAPVADRKLVSLARDVNSANSDPATWSYDTPVATAEADQGGATEARTVWSPDGRYGVRSSREGRARLYASGECQNPEIARLLLVDRAQSGAVRTLTPAGLDCMARESMPPSAFTADGHAFITSHSGKIWRIAIPSGEATQIPFAAEVHMAVRPRTSFTHRISDSERVRARVIEHARISPDRRHAVFGAFDRIWVQALEGGTPRQLVKLDAGQFQPEWSPDGRYVAFVTWDDKNGDGAIWRVPFSATCARSGSCQAQRLTTEPNRYMRPNYSPDGQRIAAMETRLSRGKNLASRLFWIPAHGGPMRYFGRERRFNVQYANLYMRSGDATHAMDVQTLADVVGGRALRETVRCVISRHALVEESAVTHDETRPTPEAAATLTVSDARRADPPWHLRSGVDYPCAGVLSPDGTKVVFRRINGELYLFDLPKAFDNADQTVTLGVDRARLISAPGLGGDDPAWSPDGRLITFTFGHTLYQYDLSQSVALDASEGAQLRAIPIAASMPRTLPDGAVIFRNARLITMRGDEVIEAGDLLVRGRRIAAVGLRGAVSIPPGTRVVDARGLTIIPGLLDLHNHGFTQAFISQVHDSRDPLLETNLAFGVLNSRDPQSYLTDVLTTEDRIEAGLMLAPRFRTTFVGVGNSSATWVANQETASGIVHRYGSAGLQVGYLKEYLSGPRLQRQLLVRAAAAEGLNVTSHGNGLRHLLTNAIDGYGGFDHPVIAVPLYEDVLELLAKTGIAWADNNWRWALPAYFMPRLSAAELEKLHRLYKPRANAPFAGSLDVILQRHLESYGLSPRSPESDVDGSIRMAASLARAIKRGVRVVNGSHGDDVPGLGTHLQIWAYVEGGASPLEALRTSTLWSAEALDLGSDLGSLDPGKLADIVVLERNPLERIQNTIAIRYVMSSGRLYDADTLVEVRPTSN